MPRLVKAITTGLAAVGVTAIVGAVPLVATMVKYRATLSTHFGDISYTVPLDGTRFAVVHWHLVVLWPVLFLVFAAAFFWQYRRNRPLSVQ